MAGTITAQLSVISLADTVTGWSGTSGQLDTEVYKQAVTIGTDGAYTYQTGKNSLEACTFTPATNINMTANYTTPHLYWTMRCDVFPFCELLNTSTTNSGLMVRVTDGAGNFTQWHVAGRDTWDGSWRNFVLDLTNTANVHSSSGTLSLADVDIITWYTDNSNSGNIRIIDNTWLDSVRYGDGLQANSTTTEAFDFTDIALDDALTANYYGVIQDYNGVLFCQGGLVLGDATDTNDTNFVSLNETVYFVDNIVSTSHYGITGIEATTATNPTDIDITGLVCKTVGNTGAEFDFSDADINSFALKSSTLINMGATSLYVGTTTGTTFSGCGTTDLLGTHSATSCSWINSGQIDLNTGGTLTGCTIDNSTAASSVLTSDLEDIDDCTFISDGSNHAVEITGLGDGSLTWNSTATNYATVDGSTGNETIYVNFTSATDFDIVVSAGATTPTIRTAAGYTGTVSVLVGQVTAQWEVLDESDNSAIQGAAVTIKAGAVGSLPYQDSVTITRTGDTATVSHTGHGLTSGKKVYIEGADQNEYNRIKTITVVDANSYTYTVTGTPTTPATGTITSTAIIADGTTDINGKISDTRSYSANQSFTGLIQKGTGLVVYKQRVTSGTIDSANGISQTILLSKD